MRKISITIIAAIFAVNLNTGFCQKGYDEGNSQLKHNSKRSAIVESDGYAYLSEDKTIGELRQQALTNAKRNALEKAETYIKSFTKVKNFVLDYDLIQSEAEGYIKILENRDYGITSDNRYHYWIKAEVVYTLKKPEENVPINILSAKKAPLTVSVWTEKVGYTLNDEIHIFIKGNKDFYARIVYKDASGNVLQILPNQNRSSNFFKGGKVYTIPEKSDQFRLLVEPPFGKEKIIVYASSASLGDVPIDAFGEDFYKVRGSLENYSTKTRGVKIVKRETGKSIAGAEFYESIYELITRPKKK